MDWQTYTAPACVALTAAIFLWRLLSPKARKTSCCSSPRSNCKKSH